MTSEGPKKLASFHQLHVEIIREADEELLQHLQDTILGTPGGLQYQHTKITQKLRHIRSIYFMLLKKSGHLIGSVGLVDRETACGCEVYKSWYVRYFSIRAPLRDRKYKPGKSVNDASRSAGLLYSVAQPYFEQPGLLDHTESQHNPALLYAYIEKANFRSLRFSTDMGLELVRSFTTILFSRLRLKSRPGVVLAEPGLYPAIMDKLKAFYARHSMFYSGNIFMDGNYFIFQREGKMVGGLQVHPDAWKIAGRGGLAGKFLLDILPRIPGVRKIFDPMHFRFLAIEGIWFNEGCEDCLEPLLESVCSYFETHIAMMWFDTECPALLAFRRFVNTGIFGKMVRSTEAGIRVRFYEFSRDQAEEFKKRPAYLSAYDMI